MSEPTESETGQCPRCSGTFALTKTRTMAPHYPPNAQQGTDVRMARCPGSGEAPLDDQQPIWR
ncbi:hypothetical protein C8259_08970 [Nocardia nova]|uniref:Uncharacterized protein n=1 Tax=Nocardia nova TaxID=37330 RepID=A0A2T2Z883_9NOCA|nr:hypothetical protein C8259_08970 [Nocardia nova]